MIVAMTPTMTKRMNSPVVFCFKMSDKLNATVLFSEAKL